MNRITKVLWEDKGSVTIEAALIIPFVIAIATLFFGLLTAMHDHAVDQIQLDAHMVELSMQSYPLTRMGIFSSEEGVESVELLDALKEGNGDALIEEMGRRGKKAIVNQWVKHKLGVHEESGSDVEGSWLLERQSMYEKDGMGEVLLSKAYGFPLIEQDVELKLLYGGMVVMFEGEGSYSYSHQDEDDNDTKEEVTVYATASGSKYHTDPNCFHIKVHATGKYWKRVPSKNICKYCGNGNAYQPNQWIYTTRNSRVVHLDRECTAIKHDIRQMTLVEAKEDGLSACKSCGLED